MNKRIYPNHWPQHLMEGAPIHSILAETPAGCHTLDFSRMNYLQFEQFCWWLLRKDFEFVGCQHIGGSGQEQGGIDLFAHDKLRVDQLVVFECKCWKELTRQALKAAVERFLTGPWCQPSSRYVLIVAQEDLGKCAQTWDEESAKLKKKGIDCEFWTALHLTERVQRFPDIIAKFFSPAAAHTFGNHWMQKVGFIERLHKALTDERAEIRALANQYLNQTPTRQQEIEKIHESEGSLQIDLPWVHLHALLPSKRDYPGSASIEIRKADTAGLTVVLSQAWLLANMAGAEGAPLAKPYRPFLVAQSKASDASDTFIIDLENCRLSLPAEGLAELAYAADKFSHVFTQALLQKESEWGASDFPFIGKDGPYVAMCSMSDLLWQHVLEFACAHDVDDGKSQWHIFDRNRHYLKVYTTKPHADFEPGYHGIFYLRKDLEELDFNHEAVVLWQPPMLEHGCDNRKWMHCDHALQWLTSKLLPAVGQWVGNQQAKKKGLLGRATHKREFMQWWGETAEIHDLRSQPLFRHQAYRQLGLVATVGQLQAEMHGEARQIYLSSAQIKQLYQGLVLILRGGYGYAGYMASKLGLKASSHQEIIAALHQKIAQSELTIDNFSLDCMLRAFLEALNDDDAWLTVAQRDSIFAALLPVMQFVDMQDLYKRHTKWL